MGPTIGRGTILVVSDDPAVAEDLRFGLRPELDTVAATDARVAWKELAAGLVPVAVVVDLQTGSAGGFALARDMADSARVAQVPLVMLIERDQDAWLADQAGARIVLRKPLEPGMLVDAVMSALPEAPASSA